MAKLKLCPFCGGEAKVVVSSTEYGKGIVGWRFGVECQDCPVRLTRIDYELSIRLSGTGEIETIVDERDEAAAAWNRRPIDGPT